MPGNEPAAHPSQTVMQSSVHENKYAFPLLGRVRRHTCTAASCGVHACTRRPSRCSADTPAPCDIPGTVKCGRSSLRVLITAIEALARVRNEGLQLHQRRSTWSLLVAPGSLASRLHTNHVNANAPVPAAKRTLLGLNFGLRLNMRGLHEAATQRQHSL